MGDGTEKSDPLEVAELIEAMLATLPEADVLDRLIRARLEGYALGLRHGVAGKVDPTIVQREPFV